MDTFYCPELTKHTRSILLPESEMKHAVQVKRQRVGDPLRLVNGKGIIAEAVIDKISRNECSCRIETLKETLPASHALTVAMSTIRPNRMDYAVEKLCEIGVKNIQFLHMKNTSIHTFKQSHLEKIAISAMKQSRQAWLTTLIAPISFSNWINQLPEEAEKYIALPNPVLTREKQKKAGKKLMLIGPEGGFSKEETETVFGKGFAALHLGNTILRSETAAVVAAAALNLMQGEITG